MPTTEELKELAQNCTFKKVETKDAAGNVTERYITCTSSKNSNSIKINLPLTGSVTEIDYDGMGVDGLWGNALSKVFSVEAVCLNLSNPKKPVVTTDQRPFGYAIQAVYVE